MTDMTQYDVTEIKRRLGSIEQRQQDIRTEQAVMANTIINIERSLKDQIHIAVREYVDENKSAGRAVSGWVISVISVLLFALFGSITVAFQIWGG